MSSVKSPPSKAGANSHLSLSQAGIALILGFEGFSARLYDDAIPLSQQKTSTLTGAARGNSTIGYGHLVHRGPTDGGEPDKFKAGISESEARALFIQDVSRTEQVVRESVKVDLTQNEFDALVSFAYNAGSSNLNRLISNSGLNQGHYDQVPVHLVQYVNAGHKKVQGLETRRAKEAAMFSQGALWQNQPAPLARPLNKAGSQADREAAKLARKERIGERRAKEEGHKDPSYFDRAKAYLSERNRKLANYEATELLDQVDALPDDPQALQRELLIGMGAQAAAEAFKTLKDVLGPITTFLGVVGLAATGLALCGVLPAAPIAAALDEATVTLGLIGVGVNALYLASQTAYSRFVAKEVKSGFMKREALVNVLQDENKGIFDCLLDTILLAKQLKDFQGLSSKAEQVQQLSRSVQTSTNVLQRIGAVWDSAGWLFKDWTEGFTGVPFWIETFKGIWEKIELWERVRETSSEAWKKVKAEGGHLLGLARSGGHQALEFSKDVASKAWSGAKAGAGSAWSFAKGVFGKAEDAAIGVGKCLGFVHDLPDGALTGPFDPKLGELEGTDPERAVASGATVFVNGINTSLKEHKEAALRVAKDTNRTVVGVYNASGVPEDKTGILGKIGTGIGFVRDLAQCAGDKMFGSSGNPATHRLKQLILDYGDKNKKNGGLTIEAHSQGSIIVSEALREAAAEGADISREKVTTWGNASWTFPAGPTYQHNVHAHDLMPEAFGTDSPIGHLMNTNPAGRWLTQKVLGPIDDAASHTTVLPGPPGTKLPSVLGGKELPGLKAHDLMKPGDGYFDQRTDFEKAAKKGPGKPPPASSSSIGGGLGSMVADKVAQGYEMVSPLIRSMPVLPAIDATGPMVDQGLRAAGRGAQSIGGMISQGWNSLFGSGDQGNETIQRSGQGPSPDVDPSRLRQRLVQNDPGSPVSADLQERLTPHLGFDPGVARLHVNTGAAEAARKLHAEAFTIGRDVFFGANHYDPHSPEGMGLIAHELTHVGQQGGQSWRGFSESGGDAMEAEAQKVAQSMIATQSNPSPLLTIDEIHTVYDCEEPLSPSQVRRLELIEAKAIQRAAETLNRQVKHSGQIIKEARVDVDLDLDHLTDDQAVVLLSNAIVKAIHDRLGDNLSHVEGSKLVVQARTSKSPSTPKSASDYVTFEDFKSGEQLDDASARVEWETTYPPHPEFNFPVRRNQLQLISSLSLEEISALLYGKPDYRQTALLDYNPGLSSDPTYKIPKGTLITFDYFMTLYVKRQGPSYILLSSDPDYTRFQSLVIGLKDSKSTPMSAIDKTKETDDNSAEHDLHVTRVVNEALKASIARATDPATGHVKSTKKNIIQNALFGFIVPLRQSSFDASQSLIYRDADHYMTGWIQEWQTSDKNPINTPKLPIIGLDNPLAISQANPNLRYLSRLAAWYYDKDKESQYKDQAEGKANSDIDTSDMPSAAPGGAEWAKIGNSHYTRDHDSFDIKEPPQLLDQAPTSTTTRLDSRTYVNSNSKTLGSLPTEEKVVLLRELLQHSILSNDSEDLLAAGQILASQTGPVEVAQLNAVLDSLDLRSSDKAEILKVADPSGKLYKQPTAFSPSVADPEEQQAIANQKSVLADKLPNGESTSPSGALQESELAGYSLHGVHGRSSSFSGNDADIVGNQLITSTGAGDGNSTESPSSGGVITDSDERHVNIYAFKEYSSSLTTSQQFIFDKIVQDILFQNALEGGGSTSVVIDGFADRAMRISDPYEQANKELEVSRARALNVKAMLVHALSKGGMDSAGLAITSQWYGSDFRLVDQPASEAQRAMNRRVHFGYNSTRPPDPPPSPIPEPSSKVVRWKHRCLGYDLIESPGVVAIGGVNAHIEIINESTGESRIFSFWGAVAQISISLQVSSGEGTDDFQSFATYTPSFMDDFTKGDTVINMSESILTAGGDFTVSYPMATSPSIVPLPAGRGTFPGLIGAGGLFRGRMT